MNILDELSQLPWSTRRNRFRDPATLKAFHDLGMQPVFSWLEKNIESQVGKEWGDLLFQLNTDWYYLSRWMQLSKLHCLAAVDALLRYANISQMPNGAHPALIDFAIKRAIESFGNLRLFRAARIIRHAWPIGPPIRHVISVPPALAEVAKVLLGNNSDLIHQWHESMATALNPADSPYRVWHALMDCAAENQLLTVLDWKESPNEFVATLRELRCANETMLWWESFMDFEGETTSLLRAITSALKGQEKTLVAFDRGGDEYLLSFIPHADVAKITALVGSFKDESMRVEYFG